jgi:hypothetical protein
LNLAHVGYFVCGVERGCCVVGVVERAKKS